jgi:hypothetical protein
MEQFLQARVDRTQAPLNVDRMKTSLGHRDRLHRRRASKHPSRNSELSPPLAPIPEKVIKLTPQLSEGMVTDHTPASVPSAALSLP